jgi:hypothetical protein
MLRQKISNQIPFGFKDSEEPNMLEPVEKEQEMITHARDLYDSGAASLRDLISWIHENTGRKLSPRGMQKVLRRGW